MAGREGVPEGWGKAPFGCPQCGSDEWYDEGWAGYGEGAYVEGWCEVCGARFRVVYDASPVFTLIDED